MPAIIPERRRPSGAPLWKRLLWFAAFYLVGLVSVAAVAYGLRLWLKA